MSIENTIRPISMSPMPSAANAMTPAHQAKLVHLRPGRHAEQRVATATRPHQGRPIRGSLRRQDSTPAPTLRAK
jgi:hypothetical protein